MNNTTVAMDCPDNLEALLAEARLEPFPSEELQQITTKLVRGIREWRKAEFEEKNIRPRTPGWQRGLVIASAAAAAVVLVYAGCSLLRTRKIVRDSAGVPVMDPLPKKTIGPEPIVTNAIADARVQIHEIGHTVDCVQSPAIPIKVQIASSSPSKHGTEAPVRKYIVVVAGDSLSTIAQRELGSANRWPAIWQTNRHMIDDPDRLKPGQRLEIVEVRANP